MIVDTDVLVWDLRGNVRAKDRLMEGVPFSVSVVTYIDLIQGMRNRDELRTLARQLDQWSVSILQIDSGISSRAMYFVETFFLSHSMQLADAIIGATAVSKGTKLLTANAKHYRHLPDIELEVFEPEEV